MVGFKISQRHACRLAKVGRSTLRYKSCAKDQTALKMRLRDLAAVRVRWGYRRLHVLLGREGWKVNHKRIYRLYKLEGLEIRTKHRKKKRAAVPRIPCPSAVAPNDRWSMDFVSDRLTNGRAFRMLTLVDNISRVSPILEADFAITGKRVTEVLDRAVEAYGLPKAIQVDNGPEFAGKDLDVWAYRRGVTLCFSRPGKPTDNAFVESFNGKLRAECLNTHWFETLEEAQAILEAWRREYNTERPHTALGLKTPVEFAEKWQPPEAKKSIFNTSFGPEKGCGSKSRFLTHHSDQKKGAGQCQRVPESPLVLHEGAAQCICAFKE
jgi:putative transposase